MITTFHLSHLALLALGGYLLAGCSSRVAARVEVVDWIRPGISFVRGIDARGIDAPLLTARTTAVQVDVPVMF